MPNTNIEAWLNQALDALDQDDYIAASDACVRALEIDPNNPDALFVSALLNIKLGDTREALAILHGTLETNPDHQASRELRNKIASQLTPTTTRTVAANDTGADRSYAPMQTVPIAFICGCGHSGTTLIANILRVHPEIYVPTVETNMFLAANRWQKPYSLLVQQAMQRGANLIVEKTPRHIRHLDRVRQAFPSAKIIIPVRDPRDVATSIAIRTGNIGEGIGRWINDNAIASNQSDRRDVLIYQHEELISSPQNIVKRICDFLSVPYDDQLLEYHKHPANWFGESRIEKGTGAGLKEHRKLRNWQVNQPIFDNRGRWRKDLDEEQIRELNKRLSDSDVQRLLHQLGYENAAMEVAAETS